MTDRTHPDSGRITGGIVEMLQARAAPQPATTITVEQVEDYIGLQSGAWDTIGAEKIVEAVLRLANIAPHPAPQAVRESQPMPDLTQLTERGAKAWAGVDAQGLREGFTAADMATAEARGFRDGVASVAASAVSEPVAYCPCCNGSGDTVVMDSAGPDAREIPATCPHCGGSGLLADAYHGVVKLLAAKERKYLECCAELYVRPIAAPPTAQAEGWRPIETAPKDGAEILLYAPACEYEGATVKPRTTYGHWRAPSETPSIKYQDGFAPEPEWEDFEPFWASWDGGFTAEHPPTHWMPLPLPPTSAEGVEHG